MDSCCVDKSSSAELSKAIDSIFAWYERARVCYAYLSDVPSEVLYPGKTKQAFCESEWFKRGWKHAHVYIYLERKMIFC